MRDKNNIIKFIVVGTLICIALVILTTVVPKTMANSNNNNNSNAITAS